MEENVRDYFRSWIEKDISVMEDLFAPHIEYSECYGPVYQGKEQCLRWFADWNAKGSVLTWDIQRIELCGTTCFVEWFFRCDYDGVGEFNGCSIIEFTKDGQIESVKEFQSTCEHTYPYGKARL